MRSLAMVFRAVGGSSYLPPTVPNRSRSRETWPNLRLMGLLSCRVRPLVHLLVIAALLMVTVPGALAQETAEPDITLPDPLTPDAVHALVSRLSDREVRGLLLQELESRETAAQVNSPTVLTLAENLTFVAYALVDHVARAVMSAPENARATVSAIESYLRGLGRSGLLRLIFAILAAFAAGFVIDVLYWRLLLSNPSTRGPATALAVQFPASVPYLARRLIRETGGAVLALAAAGAVLVLTLPPPEARIGMTVVLWVWFVPRLAQITLRFLLSPKRADLRLVATDDRTARLLTVNLVGLLLVVGLIETVLRVVDEIGATDAAMQSGFWVNALVFAWLAALIVLCRTGLQSIVRGRGTDPTGWQTWIVRAYPAVAVVAIFLSWLTGTTAGMFGKEEVARNGRHLVSLAFVLLAPMFDTAIRGGVRILVPPMRGTGAAALAAFEAASRSYVRIARVIVFGATIVILAWLWDISLFGRDGPSGGLFSGVYLEGLLIALCGFVAIELTSIFFNRKLADEVASVSGNPAEMDEGPVPAGVSSRLGTILPPLSWALQAAIIVVTVLTALGHVGLNVTALLAGAGVIGIAVGFGAQKLVADVVSGLFFLIEDAFRLNEYINAGSVEGSVEKIALRSLLLRKSDGALHCVPYSSIDAVTNFSRDWGTMKQVFTVPFDTNIEKVRKIFKKIGADLAEIPEYKDALIQPFKFKGVGQVNDIGIVVRGKFMFKPEKAQQFMIQRDIYRRVQSEFAAAGIEFARREVHVSVDRRGQTGDGLSEAAAAATGAVATPS